METYTLQQLPPAYRRISIAYFDNVTNSAGIKKELVRSALMEGPEGDAARRRMDFAFVEGDVIVSRLHLLTAIQTALLTSLPQLAPSTTPSSSTPTSASTTPTPPSELPESPALKTKTHNIHSEILLALNTNNNISDALRAYSVSEKTKRLLVVRIASESASSEKELYNSIAEIVQGQLTSLDTLEANADWKKVDKLYKLAELNQAIKALGEAEKLQRKRAAVVGTVAVKPST